jgi:ligand-binding sensor domain-containing protein
LGFFLFSARARADESFVHTRDVRALALFEGAVWVASTGGVERYALGTYERTHHFTQAQGLDALDVLALEADGEKLFARTARSRCELSLQGARCEPSAAPPPAPKLLAHSNNGWSVSAELSVGADRLWGTRGGGLWLERGESTRALTPVRQICTNHVQALAAFRGELFVGGFRDGLCVRRAGGFDTLATPFRFVNALLALDDVMFVAAHEGLFRTHDGLTFIKVPGVNEHGVNGLARSGNTLYVTTPGTLYRVPLAGGKVRTLRRPGGSLALQGVSVYANDVWLASEDRGVLRLRGKHVTPFDALSGLASSWVLDVTVDARGTAYAATLKDGLFAISPRGEVRAVPLASKWLLKLGWLSGALWVGSQDGLLSMSSREPARCAGSSVHALLEWNGQMWMGSESGLFVEPVSGHAPGA